MHGELCTLSAENMMKLAGKLLTKGLELGQNGLSGGLCDALVLHEMLCELPLLCVTSMADVSSWGTDL